MARERIAVGYLYSAAERTDDALAPKLRQTAREIDAARAEDVGEFLLRDGVEAARGGEKVKQVAEYHSTSAAASAPFSRNIARKSAFENSSVSTGESASVVIASSIL